jgi:hypothetical protein
VPAGDHTVRWMYHTPGLTAGAVISVAGLAGAVGWCAWLILARRRLGQPKPSNGETA